MDLVHKALCEFVVLLKLETLGPYYVHQTEQCGKRVPFDFASAVWSVEEPRL